MIKLGGSNTRKFVSSTINHTNNNASVTQYAINHNFGQLPDLITCDAFVDGVWTPQPTIYKDTSFYGGYVAGDSTSTINTAYVRINSAITMNPPQNLTGVTPIRFTCFIF